MKKVFALVAAGIGALAFWRRKTLKEDAGRVKDVGVDAATKVKDRLGPAEETAESTDEASSEGVETEGVDAEGVDASEAEDAGSDKSADT